MQSSHRNTKNVFKENYLHNYSFFSLNHRWLRLVSFLSLSGYLNQIIFSFLFTSGLMFSQQLYAMDGDPLVNKAASTSKRLPKGKEPLDTPQKTTQPKNVPNKYDSPAEGVQYISQFLSVPSDDKNQVNIHQNSHDQGKLERRMNTALIRQFRYPGRNSKPESGPAASP